MWLSSTYCFHWPEVTNSGTGAIGVVGSGVGASGTRAIATAVIMATRTGPRADGCARTRSMARWQPRASTMPTIGAMAIAQRVGTAELSTGTLCSTDQMPGMPVLMPLRKIRGPSDMAAKSSATPVIASTATCRRIQTTRPRKRMTMPQPKKAFSSSGFCARRSLVTLLPATDRVE